MNREELKKRACLIRMSDFSGAWTKAEGRLHKVEVEIIEGEALCAGVENISIQAEAGDILIFQQKEAAI